MILAKTLEFDVLTIILLVTVAAFVIAGAIIGVLKMLVQLGSSIISAVCALFLAKPLGTVIYKLGLFNWIIDKSTNFLLKTHEIFTQIITPENKTTLIKQGLSELNIPSLFNSIIANLGKKFIPETNGLSIAEYLSESCFIIVSIVLSGLILYGVIRLSTFLLSLLIKKLDKVKVIGVINHVFGGIVGLGVGLISVAVIMVLVTLFMMIPQINESLSKIMFLDNNNVWTLSKWLYELNILAIILKLLSLG